MKKLLFLMIIPIIFLGTLCLSINFSNNLILSENLNHTRYKTNSFALCESIFFDSLNEFNVSETPEKIKIILNKVSVYEEASTDSEIIGQAFYGEVFNVISTQNEFYEIEFAEEVYGFVLTAYALDTQIKSPKIILDTNASLTKSSFVYELKNNEFIKINDIVLDATTRIKILEGYDVNKTYCKASFDFEDEILTYYFLTDNISPDGVSPRFITAIMLIIVCVSIFLILYSFFRGRKRK